MPNFVSVGKSFTVDKGTTISLPCHVDKMQSKNITAHESFGHFRRGRTRDSINRQEIGEEEDMAKSGWSLQSGERGGKSN